MTILFEENFERANFMKWHQQDDANFAGFYQMPDYSNPLEHGSLFGWESYNTPASDDLATLVTSPTRTSTHSFMAKVKNSVNGSENGGIHPSDCDNGDCTRRRTELTLQKQHAEYYDAMPYLSERWMSVSIFIPEDWVDNMSGEFGPTVWQVKPANESGLSSMVSIEASRT